MDGIDVVGRSNGWLNTQTQRDEEEEDRKLLSSKYI